MDNDIYRHSFPVVSSVSSRLHLHRLSRADLRLPDVRSAWRTRNFGGGGGLSALNQRLRSALSRVKVQLPKMPATRARRGWCGCFQKDEAPEITYCVVNANGMLHLQTMTPTQPMPEEAELNAKFAELVEELDLTPPNRAAMLALPPEKKWQIYCNRKKDSGEETNVSNLPEQYIAKVNAISQLSFAEENEDEMKSRTKMVDGLKTALRTQPHSFVLRFVELHGLPCLLDALSSMDPMTAHSPLHYAYIGCIKALMNNSTGRAHVLAHPLSIKVISQSLAADNPKVKMAVLEILGAVCLVPGGHRKVLEAMLHFQDYAGERTRFQTIINDLDRSIGAYRDDVGLKTAIMSFINALLNYGPGEDNLEFRLHLRYELLMLGIQPAIDKLRAHENQTLDRHLDFFEMVRAEDERELARRYDEVHVNTKSVSSMVECLRKKLTHTAAFPHFLSVLQRFLLLPLDYGSHPYHWLLFDRIVQQIVLQSENGEDPDVAPLEIDVRKIVQLLATEQELLAARSKAEDLEKENNELCGKLALKDQELDLRLQEKEDAEDSLNRLKEKFERETLQHSETRQKIHDLEFTLNELNQQLQLERQERGRLELIISTSGTSLPDDAKANIKTNFSFTPTPLSSLISKGPDSIKAPPPPPPPPPMGGGGPPPPPPPGPPSLSSAKPVVKKDIPSSSVPLKCFNWTKLPEAKVGGTIWAELDEAKLYKMIDLAEFDRLFSAYQRNGITNEGSSEDLRQIGKPKAKTAAVIDGRRAQNCTILLSKLKMSNEDLIRAILSMDSKEELPMDMVEQLLKFVPTNEERALLDEHTNDIDNLSRADRFLYDVSKISRYEQRLNTLYYKKRFAQSISELKPKIGAILEASKEVSRSKKLKKLLELVLALGNYMNRGQRGNAIGFRISSLNRLADTKSSTSKHTTLLHYLVDILEAKFKDVLKLEEDLGHVREASKVNLSELEKEMGQLRNGLKEVERELEYHRSHSQSGLNGDRFIPAVKEFLASATYKFSEVEDTFQDMKSRFERVVQMFGDDASNAQPDEVFGVFDVFLANMAEARQENEALRRRKEEDEKRAQQEAEMRKRTIDRRASKDGLLSRVASGLGFSKSSAENGTVTSVNGDKGEFDDLISALRAGDVFGEDMVKMRRNRRKVNGSPHRGSQSSATSYSRENSRERTLGRRPL